MRIWAHRGSHGTGGPLENTAAAFERAIAEGADGIELDVHLSRDGVPVVFHDETLARLTDDADPRRIDRLDAATLTARRLVGGFHMPTLADVLDLVAGRVALNIELKDPDGVEATARLFAGRSTAGVMLSSFAPRAVAAAAERLPRLPRALIVEPRTAPVEWAPAIMPFAALARVRATHWHPFHRLVHRRLVSALAARGVAVCAWTVNDPAIAARLAGCGVDGIMTDRPGWLRAALARRG